MLKCWCFCLSLTLLLLLCVILLLISREPLEERDGKRQLVAALGITDLALCSEARYTRHPSQADLFSAFQDFPGSFEHFPTGSLILPQPIGFEGRVVILSKEKAQ